MKHEFKACKKLIREHRCVTSPDCRMALAEICDAQADLESMAENARVADAWLRDKQVLLDAARSEIADLGSMAENARISDLIYALKTQVTSLITECSGHAAELLGARSEVASLKADNDRLSENARAADARLNAARSEIASLKADLESMAENVRAGLSLERILALVTISDAARKTAPDEVASLNAVNDRLRRVNTDYVVALTDIRETVEKVLA